MKAPKRPATTPTEVTVETFGEAITARQFAGGSQLPGMPLTELLHTSSRATVREALGELEGPSLLGFIPHGDAFIASLTPSRARPLVALRAVLDPCAALVDVDRPPDEELIADVDVVLGGQRRTAVDGGIRGLPAFGMTSHQRLAQTRVHLRHVRRVAFLVAQIRRFVAQVRHLGSLLQGVVARHAPILDKELLHPPPDESEAAVRGRLQRAADGMASTLAEEAGPDPDGGTGTDPATVR